MPRQNKTKSVPGRKSSEPLILTVKNWERFWGKVDKTSPTKCWFWESTLDRRSYGVFGICGRMYFAHRIAFISAGGVIPKGAVLDHLCRHASCVNPKHLEPVSQHENVLRGNSGVYLRDRKFCIHGHEFTKENVRFYWTGHRRHRACRECERLRWHRYRKYQSKEK